MTLKELIDKIEERQFQINNPGPLEESVLKKINYRFRLDWNYYSNRMEGGTLTKSETRTVMIGNITVEGKPIKDVMEMSGHDKVVLEVIRIGKNEKRLSEKRIKEIHKAIMHEDDGDKKKYLGEWKRIANEIINYKNEKIVFVAPEEVADEMHKLLNETNAALDKFFNNPTESKHPVLIASEFHIRYVSIHPFYDGNGRTARIFTNLLLIACGLPVIIIKDEHKENYHRLLGDIQAYGGNPDLFHAFIAQRILESQQIIIDAIAGKDIDESDDVDKRLALLKKKLPVEDKVQELRTSQTLLKALNEVAFPLFNTLMQKCDRLYEFFLSNSLQIFYCYQDNRNHYLKNTEGNIDIWNTNQFKAITDKADSVITRLTFVYELKGFKKNLQSRGLIVIVAVWFEEFYYTVTINNESRDRTTKMAYGNSIEVSQINGIVKKAIDDAIDEIETMIEQP